MRYKASLASDSTNQLMDNSGPSFHFYNEFHLGDCIFVLRFLYNLREIFFKNNYHIYFHYNDVQNKNFTKEIMAYAVPGLIDILPLTAKKPENSLNTWMGIEIDNISHYTFTLYISLLYKKMVRYMNLQDSDIDCSFWQFEDYHSHKFIDLSSELKNFDILIINSKAHSGQYNNNDDVDILCKSLNANYNIITTKKIEGIQCTLDNDFKILDIATIASNVQYVIAVMTGPLCALYNKQIRDSVKKWFIIVSHGCSYIHSDIDYEMITDGNLKSIYDYFTNRMIAREPSISSSTLLNYENFPLNETKIYNNVDEFVSSTSSFKFETNTIIYLLNWGCGFGSALTVFIQNMYYLHTINKYVHVLPLFCTNTDSFKYHDVTLNNTFFKYYSYNISNIDMQHFKVYFIKSIPTSSIPFFTADLPPCNSSPNKEYIEHFNKYFTLRIGDHIREYINNIKSQSLPVIGIHIRSLAQKRAHCTSYLSKGIKARLTDLKIVLDTKFAKYNVFIATDVTFYINYAEEVFGKVHYIKDISRINNEDDSVPQLTNTGTKLGNDILYDCLALSLCDTIYISNSNIPYIISTINPAARMIEY